MTVNLATQSGNPKLSIVIPVYNEEDGLPALFDRLYPALDTLASKHQLCYEIVFVNDGSKDRSAGLLAQQVDARPDVTRAILFHSNFGQHMAIMAGFEYTRGEYKIHQKRSMLWYRNYSKAMIMLARFVQTVAIASLENSHRAP